MTRKKEDDGQLQEERQLGNEEREGWELEGGREKERERESEMKKKCLLSVLSRHFFHVVKGARSGVVVWRRRNAQIQGNLNPHPHLSHSAIAFAS